MNSSTGPAWLHWGVAMLLTGSPATSAADDHNTFDAEETGRVPDGLLVMDGRFAVQEFQGDRVLELPGSPLETFGVLFGSNAREGIAACARIHGTSQGRRSPAFAVSLGGVSGYRLQVAPAKRTVELLKGDELLHSVPWTWTSGTWTHLRLEIIKTSPQEWNVRGKVWTAGTDPPTDWTIALGVQSAPVSGMAGVWGKPFSGTPIRFDDLRQENLEP